MFSVPLNLRLKNTSILNNIHVCFCLAQLINAYHEPFFFRKKPPPLGKPHIEVNIKSNRQVCVIYKYKYTTIPASDVDIDRKYQRSNFRYVTVYPYV